MIDFLSRNKLFGFVIIVVATLLIAFVLPFLINIAVAAARNARLRRAVKKRGIYTPVTRIWGFRNGVDFYLDFGEYLYAVKVIRSLTNNVSFTLFEDGTVERRYVLVARGHNARQVASGEIQSEIGFPLRFSLAETVFPTRLPEKPDAKIIPAYLFMPSPKILKDIRGQRFAALDTYRGAVLLDGGTLRTMLKRFAEYGSVSGIG